MMNNAGIKNREELEFAVFCIENIASRMLKKSIRH